MERVNFSPPVDPIDLFGHPLWAQACTLPPHNKHWYRGLAVRLGDWVKTTESEGLQVVYVPSDRRFKPRSPRYGLFLVLSRWCPKSGKQRLFFWHKNANK